MTTIWRMNYDRIINQKILSQKLNYIIEHNHIKNIVKLITASIQRNVQPNIAAFYSNDSFFIGVPIAKLKNIPAINPPKQPNESIPLLVFFSLFGL